MNLNRVNLEAKIEEAKSKLSVTEMGIEDIRSTMKPLQEKLSFLCERRKKEKESIIGLQHQIAMEGDFEEQARFYLGAVNGGDLIYKLTDNFFKDLGLRTDGYSPYTEHHCLRISMNPDGSNVEQVFDSLSKLIPLLKPNENGNIKIGVFEDSLAADGSYQILYIPDTKEFKFGIYSWGFRATKSSHCLKTILEYIAKNHYYS